jgi:hypothetical protein
MGGTSIGEIRAASSPPRDLKIACGAGFLMSSISRAWAQCHALFFGACGVVTAATLQLACSRQPGGSTEAASGSSSLELTGEIGMQVTLPSGVQLNSVRWAITGPNRASVAVQAGTVDVRNSEAIRFLVGSIPVGTDFDVSLSGTSPDGSVTCAGSALFDIVARTTTNVSVALACATEEPESGLAFVSASAFDCASVISVTASPAETTVGGSLTVSGSATGPNASGLTYAWSASSGSFDTPTAPQSTFTCAATGLVILTLTAGDGAVPDAGPCNAALGTMATQVRCDPISDAGGTSGVTANSNPIASPDAGKTPDSSNGVSEAGDADGALAAEGDIFTAQQGVAFDGPLASFTFTDPAATASDFDAVVLWGDGTAAAAGSVTGGSSAFQVRGIHSYAVAGPFTVTISITDTFSDATAIATSSTLVTPGKD